MVMPCSRVKIKDSVLFEEGWVLFEDGSVIRRYITHHASHIENPDIPQAGQAGQITVGGRAAQGEASQVGAKQDSTMRWGGQGAGARQGGAKRFGQ